MSGVGLSAGRCEGLRSLSPNLPTENWMRFTSLWSIMVDMATDDGWKLPQEPPTWDGPFFGRFGVLAADPDGETVQCHICGDWYTLLGAHANATHGLKADAYRRAFGLRNSTGLASPSYREKRRRISAQLTTPERLEATRAAAEALSAEEMRRRSRLKRRRRQHDIEPWTEPTRTQAANTARCGTPDGYPMEVLEGFAKEFVDELQNGQKGVYARLGDRWGVRWPTARSDHAPNGHLHGQAPTGAPPGR